MPNLYDLLINGQYNGGLQIFSSVGNTGPALDFFDRPNPPILRCRQGQYNGAWYANGYWLFHPTLVRCWQAQNYMGPLKWWNEDGLANPAIPEDWELFKFEWADPNHGVLRIKQGRSSAYVGRGGDLYNCSIGEAYPQSAATFLVAFSNADVSRLPKHHIPSVPDNIAGKIGLAYQDAVVG